MPERASSRDARVRLGQHVVDAHGRPSRSARPTTQHNRDPLADAATMARSGRGSPVSSLFEQHDRRRIALDGAGAQQSTMAFSVLSRSRLASPACQAGTGSGARNCRSRTHLVSDTPKRSTPGAWLPSRTIDDRLSGRLKPRPATERELSLASCARARPGFGWLWRRGRANTSSRNARPWFRAWVGCAPAALEAERCAACRPRPRRR